jgi:hypothetical protein
LKHAGEATLDHLEPLLKEIRQLPGLHEKKRGTFYKKSSAFLHFHEDPTGIFADLKDGKVWLRFGVNSAEETEKLLTELQKRV